MLSNHPRVVHPHLDTKLCTLESIRNPYRCFIQVHSGLHSSCTGSNTQQHIEAALGCSLPSELSLNSTHIVSTCSSHTHTHTHTHLCTHAILCVCPPSPSLCCLFFFFFCSLFCSCVWLRSPTPDFHRLNEDGELWLVYEGLKETNRLSVFSERPLCEHVYARSQG